MEIIFTPDAIEDLKEWKKSGNTQIFKRIDSLLESIKRSPFEGIGKPEALKHDLKGKWSRRITDADRIVYDVEENIINVYSLKGHY